MSHSLMLQRKLVCEFDINIDFHLTRVMRVEFIEHENCNGVCVSIIITFEEIYF